MENEGDLKEGLPFGDKPEEAPADPVSEEPKDEGDAGVKYETPEDAMAKAMKEATPEAALEALQKCGFRLEKDEAPAEPMMGNKFDSMKKKAVKNAFEKFKGK